MCKIYSLQLRCLSVHATLQKDLLSGLFQIFGSLENGGKKVEDGNPASLSSEVRQAGEMTFDLRKRRFPKPTNPSRNLMVGNKENTL